MSSEQPRLPQNLNTRFFGPSGSMKIGSTNKGGCKIILSGSPTFQCHEDAYLSATDFILTVCCKCPVKINGNCLPEVKTVNRLSYLDRFRQNIALLAGELSYLVGGQSHFIATPSWEAQIHGIHSMSLTIDYSGAKCFRLEPKDVVRKLNR